MTTTHLKPRRETNFAQSKRKSVSRRMKELDKQGVQKGGVSFKQRDENFSSTCKVGKVMSNSGWLVYTID